jgi:diacylglycerol kinase family enzyme
MNASSERPDVRRRLAAVGAMLLGALVILATFATVVGDIPGLVAQLVLLTAVALAAWYGLTRVGGRRAIAVLIGLAALTGSVLIGLAREGGGPASLLVRIVPLLLAVALARFALGRNVRALKQGETPGTPVPPATHAVLIMNLKSGGGKAERFHLEDECRRRGIEPVVLQPSDDLLELARRAVDEGADVIGMAGGDGSQALVASVAAERGVPMVVVPAGTRNHLALDLGLDRDDVVGALDAFGEARQRPMDLAEVNGRICVNNVSLGLYAAIVRSPEYRDAKVDTALATLPTVLAPGTGPFDLRFVGPDGESRSGAHVIQISNNPYGSSVATLGSRPRLDTGRLGVVTLEIGGDKEAAGFLAALATGHPDRFEGLRSWSTPTFEVTSGTSIDVGLDGETLEMDPPLRFSMKAKALSVRLPGQAIGYSPAALAMGWRSATRNVWRTALGRTPISSRHDA